MLKSAVASMLRALFNTAPGEWLASCLTTAMQYRVFSVRTVHAMKFDLLRLRARRKSRAPAIAGLRRLHLGCGQRLVPGWVNADVTDSDADVDLASGQLPWPDSSFETVVSQHVIEHMELQGELIPLLREIGRVLEPGGEVWLSGPDLELFCNSYARDRASSLLSGTQALGQGDSLGMGGAPTQHYINLVFDQMGEHKNLFDFELLSWALKQTGFSRCEKVTERQLLTKFPEFPPRNDDYLSLYVRAVYKPLSQQPPQ